MSFQIENGALISYDGDPDEYEVIIPDRVMRIGEYAFYCNIRIVFVTIPEGVTEIGTGAFYGCTELSVITIPATVTKIGKDAFLGCARLTIRGQRGSFAEKYARESGFTFEETT